LTAQVKSVILSNVNREKNRAAQELGRLGGLKGGIARAAKLTETRRREIASAAGKASAAARKQKKEKKCE
jgi:hypothetical protein